MRQLCILAMLVFCSLCLGCSPGGLFGPDKNNQFKLNPNLRILSPECRGLDLSRADVPPATFRKLIICLDGNGSLGPLRTWIEKLDDEDLSFIVTWFNRTFLADAKQVNDLEGTVDRLRALGLMQPLLGDLGKVLENAEFWKNSAQILAVAGQTPQWNLFLDSVLERGNESQVQSMLETLSGVFSHPAAEGFRQKWLKTSTDFDWGKTLPPLIKRFGEVEKPAAGRPAFLDEFVQSLRAGDWARWMDFQFGTDEKSVQQTVPEFAALFGYIASDPIVLQRLGAFLISYMDSIQCVGGSLVFPNHLKLLMAEVADHMNPDQASQAMAVQLPIFFLTTRTFCKYPQDAGVLYRQVFFDLVDRGLAPADIRFIQALLKVKRDGEQPAWDLFLRLFTDSGKDWDRSLLKPLLPFASDLSRRNLLPDFFLMMSALKSESLVGVSDFMATLFAQEPTLSSQDFARPPLMSALLQSLERVEPTLWNAWADQFSVWMRSEESLWPFFLSHARDAWISTREHPVFEWFRSFALTIGKDPAYFRSIQKTTAMPEFTLALKHLSKMAMNGDLDVILRDFLGLFREYGRRTGPARVTPVQIEPLVHSWRHGLSSAVLNTSPPAPPPVPNAYQRACRELDLTVGLEQINHPACAKQLELLALCEKASDEHFALAPLFQALHGMPSTTQHDLLSFFIERNTGLVSFLGKDQTRTLIQKIGASSESASFWRFLDAFSFFSTPEAGQKSVFETFFSSLRPLARESLALSDLAQGLSAAVKAPSFPWAGQALRKALSDDETPAQNTAVASRTQPTGAELKRLARWVQNAECQRFEDAPAGKNWVLERIYEIPKEYDENVTTWDLVQGKPRKEWKFQEFKEWGELLVKKVTDPKESSEEKSALQGFLRVIHYFDKKPGDPADSRHHYTREYLAQWLKDRSNDYKPILYYYPDETEPRVRYVNTLDRLELVLLNADLTYILPYNLGLHFLAMIGEAWGDEPREVWPDEIKKRFPSGTRPMTIREVYFDILNTHANLYGWVGYPKKPKCPQTEDPNNLGDGILDSDWNEGPLNRLVPLRVRAAIFNLKQVISVMEENLPRIGTRYEGGMKVLRDLFWELYSSTPDEYRSATSGERNNLTVLTRLTRLGLARQLSRAFRDLDPEDSAVKAILEGTIELSSSQKIEGLVQELLRDSGKNSLVWNYVKLVFEILESKDAAQFKQLAFYLGANQGRWLLSDSKEFWKGPAQETLSQAVRDNRDYLASSSPWIKELLSSTRLSRSTRSLFEKSREPEVSAVANSLAEILDSRRSASAALRLFSVVDRDLVAHQAFEDFKTEWQTRTQRPEFKRLEVGKVLDGALDFLATPTGSGVRDYVGLRLKEGDLPIIIEATAQNPQKLSDAFYQAGRAIQGGQAKPFLERFLRNIPRATGP